MPTVCPTLTQAMLRMRTPRAHVGHTTPCLPLTSPHQHRGSTPSVVSTPYQRHQSRPPPSVGRKMVEWMMFPPLKVAGQKSNSENSYYFWWFGVPEKDATESRVHLTGQSQKSRKGLRKETRYLGVRCVAGCLRSEQLAKKRAVC